MIGHTLAYCIGMGALLFLLSRRTTRYPRHRLLIFLGAVVLFSIPGGGIFGTLRLLCWGLFLFLPLGCWILQPSSSRGWQGLSLLLSFGLGVVAYDAFIEEPRSLEITLTRIATPKISLPLRIVVIADLQTDAITPHEVETLEKAASLKADLVILTGDYYQSPSYREREALADRLRPLWKTLAQAPLGAFAVRGNVEWSSWPTHFESTGIHLLTETTLLNLGEFDLWALDLEDSFDPNWRDLPSQERLVVVFGHGPDFALNHHPADLSLAGHTHGGQVRLPWIGPLITFSEVPRGWASGLTEIKRKKWLYVSRGIGMERGNAPRLRFLCHPELAVIDLVPQQPP